MGTKLKQIDICRYLAGTLPRVTDNATCYIKDLTHGNIF